MPPVLLSDDEAVAVAVALRAAAGSVAKMEETSIGLLAKLDQVLPARLRKRASALHSVTITLPGSGQRAGGGRAHAHRRRLPRQPQIQVELQGPRGQSRRMRNLEPLRLAHTGRRWYLVAWDLSIARTGARSGSIACSRFGSGRAVRAAQVSGRHRGVRVAGHSLHPRTRIACS